MELLETMFMETETFGIGNIVAHNMLLKGDLLTLNIKNDINNEADKKIKFLLFSNRTIWDFKLLVSQKTKTLPQNVILSRYLLNASDITEKENGRILSEYNFKTNEILKVKIISN